MKKDVSVAENPGLFQLQGQLVLNALEHGLSLSQDNGVHHDLKFIDQSMGRQLRNNAAASQNGHVSSGFLFHFP